MKNRKYFILLSFFLLIVLLGICLVREGSFGRKSSSYEQETDGPEKKGSAEEKVSAGEKVSDGEKISAEEKVSDGENVSAEENVFDGEKVSGEITLESAVWMTEDLRVQEIMTSMSLEEKTLQLFFITPEALTGYETVTAAGDATKAALDKYPVGGIVYFARNLIDSEQAGRMLRTVQDYVMQTQKIPVFLGVDEEGGSVLRIGKNSGFSVERVDAAGELAKNKDPDVIYRAGDTIGEYLSELGFNVDFAPVADVLINADNQVIGDRSFGTDPHMVADMAWAFTEGLHDNHVLACYKHFPGHGGTVADSHTGAAGLDRTLEELREAELIPFQDGSRRGVDFIMVSHISDVKVTGGEEPASLSGYFVTDILRGELEYQGIIITDSLSMEAVSKYYTTEDAAILALQAGCDMLLMPGDFVKAYEAVYKAVQDGTIPEERLDESVERIVRAKLRWGDAQAAESQR